MRQNSSRYAIGFLLLGALAAWPSFALAQSDSSPANPAPVREQPQNPCAQPPHNTQGHPSQQQSPP